MSRLADLLDAMNRKQTTVPTQHSTQMERCVRCGRLAQFARATVDGDGVDVREYRCGVCGNEFDVRRATR